MVTTRGAHQGRVGWALMYPIPTTLPGAGTHTVLQALSPPGLLARTASVRPLPRGLLDSRSQPARALSLDQPVAETTSSSTRPLSFFLARTYALAYLLVTSALDRIDSSLLAPPEHHRFAGIPA